MMINNYKSLLEQFVKYTFREDSDSEEFPLTSNGEFSTNDMLSLFPKQFDLKNERQIKELVLTLKLESEYNLKTQNNKLFLELLLYPLDDAWFTVSTRSIDIKEYLTQNSKFFMDPHFRSIVTNFVFDAESHFEFKIAEINKYTKEDWKLLFAQSSEGAQANEFTFRFKVLAILLHLMIKGVIAADSLSLKDQTKIKKLLSLLV